MEFTQEQLAAVAAALGGTLKTTAKRSKRTPAELAEKKARRKAFAAMIRESQVIGCAKHLLNGTAMTEKQTAFYAAHGGEVKSQFGILLAEREKTLAAAKKVFG